MSDLVIMICFWSSIVLIAGVDVAMAIRVREKYPSRKDRSWLLDLPAVVYCCTMMAVHLFLEPLLFGGVAAWLLPGPPLTFLAWELYDGAPIHPLIGGTLGLAMGTCLWPI